MVYGYCRVSTKSQSVDRQIENILRSHPTAIITKEIFTGRIIQRKEWSKLLKKVQRGDTIVFDEVSRMSRNAEEGITTYEELFNKGIELVFLKEPHINTLTYKNILRSNQVEKVGTNVDFIIEGVNKYLKALAREQIKLAFEQAEKEADFIRARTKEGLRMARSNGVILGRPQGATYETKKSKEAKKIIRKHSKTFGGSLADNEVMRLCDTSRNSYYKYKKELLSELCDEGA